MPDAASGQLRTSWLHQKIVDPLILSYIFRINFDRNMNKMNSQRISQVFLTLIVILFAAISVTRAEKQVSNFNEWNISGPTGGDVRAIVVDPKDKNRIIITTLDGQIYASNNAGSSWNLLINLDRPMLILDDLIIDSRDSNIIYVSGHRHKLPGGFFKTVDGGKTWKEAKELKNEAVHAMVQSSKDPDMLLVGTVSGVWISKDSGSTWTKFTSNTTPIKLDALAVDPRDVNTIYAGTWWRAYKTTDGGQNWRLVKKGMIDDSDVFAIDINPQNPDQVIASACSGIYQSFDQGESWSKIQGIPSQSRRTRAIMQNPYKPGAVYAGTTEGFWLSANSGRNWSLTTSKQLEVNAIAVHPSNPEKIYIATNNYGVMVSNDGGRNFDSNNGNFSSRFTYNIIPDIERPNRFYATTINTATGGGFIFISDDFGRTWKPTADYGTKQSIFYSVIQDKENPNLVYAASNSGLYKSINRGLTWTAIMPPAPPRTSSTRSSRRSRAKAAPPAPTLPAGTVAALEGKVNGLIYTEDGKNGYLAAMNDGLYRSYDVEKGWQKINFGDGISEQVFAVHMSPKAPNIIWAGTAISGVVVSKDDGETWTKVGVGLIPDRVPVSTIATSPDNPNNVYVGTIQTFYMSKDGGRTWERRGGNLPLGNYNSILINPENTREIFVASALESNGGIFHSSDSGWTWERIDKGANLASTRFWGLMFNPLNSNELLAASHSAGIYRIGRTLTAKAKPEETKVITETPTIERTRVVGNNR